MMMDLSDDGINDLMDALVDDMLDEMNMAIIEEQEQEDMEAHQGPSDEAPRDELTDAEVEELERAAWIVATGDGSMYEAACQAVLRLGQQDAERRHDAAAVFFAALDCYTSGKWSTWPYGSGAEHPVAVNE